MFVCTERNRPGHEGKPPSVGVETENLWFGSVGYSRETESDRGGNREKVNVTGYDAQKDGGDDRWVD